MLYLMHEAPKEEQNFAMVMEMLEAAEVREEDDEYESPLDILFSRLEMRNPESIAVRQYRIFKMGAGKTLKSILISVGVRLSAFNLPQIARLTYTDELLLEEMGEKKVALFCCIPDSDKSLNYLVGMIFGQLIQTSVSYTHLTVGEAKTGDLAGVFGYDIYYNKTNYELAYTVEYVEDKVIVVIMAGTRENFYNELKRYMK